MTITIFQIECEHFDLRITILLCTYTVTATIDHRPPYISGMFIQSRKSIINFNGFCEL